MRIERLERAVCEDSGSSFVEKVMAGKNEQTCAEK